MATTKIWDVRGRIEKVIDYAEDPDKTRNPAAVEWSSAEEQGVLDLMVEAMEDGRAKGLISVLDYAMSDYKTEERYYVTGINCSAEHARDDMLFTKKLWNKEGGIVAYHGYQSFRPNEVDADTAHRIGVELAEKLWGDRFEVVVATHLNTNCVHNHFVLNSVSFRDGLRYRDQKKTYRRMREASDELCRKYRLSVIENPSRHGKHYSEVKAEREGKRTWTTAIREDIDNAIMQNTTWTGFVKSLQKLGYEIKLDRKYIAIRPPGKERFARLKTIGENYTEDAIKRCILRQQYRQRPPRPEPPAVKRGKMRGDFHLSKITWRGLRALYYFYRRKLREAQRQPAGYAPYALREDLRQMDAISEQTKFLFKYKLDTAEQVESCRASLQARLSSLISERNELRNEKRRVNIPAERMEEINARIFEISRQLKPLRRELYLCHAVIERSLMIEEKNRQLNEKKKEMMQQHEPTGRSSRAGRQYGDEPDGKRR